MKFRALAIAVALLAIASFGHAAIIGNTLQADGDGVITCQTSCFEQVGAHDYKLQIDGVHNEWKPGHILGDIITDSEQDPSMTLSHLINNDTGSPWTDYHVKVTMNKTFTIDNVTIANPGWTSVTTAPVQVGADWIGYVDYYAGEPIPVAGSIGFSYRMNFLGSVAFCEEMIPTPEPSTFVLLGCGLVGLLIARRRLSK